MPHTAIELVRDNLYNNSDLEEMLMRMDKMDKIGLISTVTEEMNTTIDQIALKFILSEQPVASILPNITTAEQLAEYVSASDMPNLSSETIEQITEFFDKTKDKHIENNEESQEKIIKIAALRAIFKNSSMIQRFRLRASTIRGIFVTKSRSPI